MFSNFQDSCDSCLVPLASIEAHWRGLSQHFRRQQIRYKVYRHFAVCPLRSLAYGNLVAVQSLRCCLDPIVIETYKTKPLLVLPIPTSTLRHLSAQSSFHTMAP